MIFFFLSYHPRLLDYPIWYAWYRLVQLYAWLDQVHFPWLMKPNLEFWTCKLHCISLIWLAVWCTSSALPWQLACATREGRPPSCGAALCLTSLLWRWTGADWKAKASDSFSACWERETFRWWSVHVRPILRELDLDRDWRAAFRLPKLNPWVTSQLVCGLAELQDIARCSKQRPPLRSPSTTWSRLFYCGYSISTHAYIELNLAVEIKAAVFFFFSFFFLFLNNGG